MSLILKQAQGNVATGAGAKFAKQIHLASGDVNFVDKKPSGAARMKLTCPEKDMRLRRPGYTNNVSVLIDLKGQEFQFKAPLKTQPVAIDIDMAYAALDRMRDGARAGGAFLPERPPPDMVGFMLKQQAKDEALNRLEKKEIEMLYEGFSPQQVALMSSEERARVIRKSQMGSRLDAALRVASGEVQHEVGTAGLSAGVGHVSITQGIQTMPALSVPMMNRKPRAGAGQADSMGRTAASGAPSAGFTANRAPATGARMTPNRTTEGQAVLPAMFPSAQPATLRTSPVPSRSEGSMTPFSLDSLSPYYGTPSRTPSAARSPESPYAMPRQDALQRGMVRGVLEGALGEVRGIPNRTPPRRGQVGVVEMMAAPGTPRGAFRRINFN